MDVPSTLYSQCPKCEIGSHNRLLKGRSIGKKGQTLKAVVKCSSCKHIYDVEIKLPKQVKIRTIVSRGTESKKTEISLPDDWVFIIGDEVMIADTCVQVTGIESDGKRVNKAKVGKIDTLWTRYYNEIVIKISTNKGRKTFSDKLVVQPQEEFTVGSEIKVGKRSIRIKKIKLKYKVLNKDNAKAMAKDVVRIYGRSPSRYQSRL